MTTQASDATTNPAPGNQPPGNQAPENQPLDNPALANEPTGLAGRYVPQDPALDEMIASDGALRPAWKSFVNVMDDLGPSHVESRWDYARRLIRENGITHNVYGAPDGMARPWNLDLIPLLLSGDEWEKVCSAMTQRARLLNAFLADVYGPAQCVSAGVVPPELIYGTAGFLRPAHGLKPPRNQWISQYAADLIRASDGSFQVLTDRTQSPSGAGYCLENRIVLSRALPVPFRECNVLRLAPYFITFRQNLASLAPPDRENPRIVLLTPGPYNETYFEHAYLARYLGFTLVQGADLLVRDCRVYLKTLGGLQRIDVILRRVDDDFCDPLELRQDSFLGIPGLLQAARDGNVAIANALGAGLARSNALMAYLAPLCSHFFSEDLKLPSVETWWCGEEKSLAYVLDNLPKLVIKPSFPIGKSDPIFAETLSAADLQTLADKIRARPRDFVAQPHAVSFNAPVLVNHRVESRRFVLRTFLTAAGDSYQVMPGGLTRVTGAADDLVVSLQQGGGSKDTWILADYPVKEISLLPPATGRTELSRGGGDLTSRVADDLFWLGRYLQRADGIVRLARCVFNRLLDPNFTEAQQTTDILATELLTRPVPKNLDAAQLAADLMADADPSGLRASINSIHNISGVLRDRISVDAWLILRDIQRDLPNIAVRAEIDGFATVLEGLNKLVIGLLAFYGMASDSMTRGQAWQFLDLGVRLERAFSMMSLIRATLSRQSSHEQYLLDSLLEVADSSLTYRRRYLTRLDVTAVVDLLLADETNPRSVAFAAAAMERHLRRLPHRPEHSRPSPDLLLAEKLRGMVRLADINAACKVNAGQRDGLWKLGGDVLDTLRSLSEVITQIYFSHAAVPRASVQIEGTAS
jgi:uncharacterized circularly permuted ATP-grasp superfamily protein/uncharacterized alpha-E superfamily protein